MITCSENLYSSTLLIIRPSVFTGYGFILWWTLSLLFCNSFSILFSHFLSSGHLAFLAVRLVFERTVLKCRLQIWGGWDNLHWCLFLCVPIYLFIWIFLLSRQWTVSVNALSLTLVFLFSYQFYIITWCLLALRRWYAVVLCIGDLFSDYLGLLWLCTIPTATMSNAFS